MLLWNPVPIPVFDPGNGERAAGALAYFYVGGTTTPLAVFNTDEGTTPHTWPVVADANGVFPPIFIPYGSFGYRVVTASGSMVSPVVSTVQNPAPASSGGGGSVPDDELIKTGFIRPDFGTGALAGYVRLNARTIGNVSSGATERANADTKDLFIFLYDRLPDAVCPVSGGRGANAKADYDAGKTLQLPNGRGKGLFGVDAMGNTESGWFAGVTFSTGSQTAPGSQGGLALHTLTAGQLPANIPNNASSSSTTTVGAPPSYAILVGLGGSVLAGSGGTSIPLSTGGVSNLNATTSTSTSTTVTINSGGGGAHNNMPPFMLVTLYIKL